MKLKLTNFLALALAGLLQFMPLLRSVLPAIQSLGSPTGALILRWVAGGVAYFGYHAVSSASSIAVSPASATIGVAYAGTITYSGGHAGAVASMSISNHCLSSGPFTLAPGLTISYKSVNVANLTGTPTGSLGTVGITMTMWDGGNCTGGLTDTRSTSLIIQNSGGGAVSPTILVPPQNTVAQVGSDVILSGGAGGNPTPQYYWKQGISFIPGATNNSFTIPASQLTNSGVYTMIASNSAGQTPSACYLTMALTPGSNILAFEYTNYVVAGTSLTMSSYLTNVPSGVSSYSWQYNGVAIGVTTSNLNLTSAQTIPVNSGTYTVQFDSTVNSTNVVHQHYDSYWVFGYLPAITNQPSPVTVNAGSNATFSATLAGSTYPFVYLYQNQTNLMAQTNLSAYNPSTGTATTNISLTISNVTQANAGSYTFVVTNSWGSITSSPAALNVTSPLSVSAPQSQTNYAGKTVSLNVTVTGATPSYRWQKDTVNLSNGGDISGATTNILTLAPAATTNSGNYRVIVTNTSGSVTSSVAAVSIVPVPPITLALGTSNTTLNAAGGVAGSNYVVLVSTNLVTGNGWVPLKTNVVSTNGSINFTDTNTPTASQRFYRLEFP